MAASTAPLIWDFYREVTTPEGLGGVIHYYDETSQSLYLADGKVATKVSEVSDGNWGNAEQGAEILITADQFSKLRLDHPTNGTLYGVATDGDTLTFLKYVYMMDLSPIMDSWSWTSQNDTPVSQFTGSAQNVGVDVFADEASVFQPGAKITVSVKMGNSQPYPIGVAWVDEFDYDISAETVDISGRNTIGYFLKDQTFDDRCEFSGTASGIVEQILAHAGVSKVRIQPGVESMPFKFEPSDPILDGLQTVLSAYTSLQNEWKLLELPDGTVCVGYSGWYATLLPNGYYSFDEGHDVFKRRTSKLSDGSYTAVRVTGRDSANKVLEPVTVPINNFKYWSLGQHRTAHLKAPDGFTQEKLQEWAEAMAQKYQYVGIGEDFTGPFRPHLLVGDVAEIVEDGVGTSLGVITEVRQTFSRRDGFQTSFTVDSGGVVTDGDSYVIYSRTAKINGLNRRQRVMDIMRYVAGK